MWFFYCTSGNTLASMSQDFYFKQGKSTLNIRNVHAGKEINLHFTVSQTKALVGNCQINLPAPVYFGAEPVTLVIHGQMATNLRFSSPTSVIWVDRKDTSATSTCLLPALPSLTFLTLSAAVDNQWRIKSVGPILGSLIQNSSELHNTNLSQQRVFYCHSLCADLTTINTTINLVQSDDTEIKELQFLVASASGSNTLTFNAGGGKTLNVNVLGTSGPVTGTGVNKKLVLANVPAFTMLTVRWIGGNYTITGLVNALANTVTFSDGV